VLGFWRVIINETGGFRGDGRQNKLAGVHPSYEVAPISDNRVPQEAQAVKNKSDGGPGTIDAPLDAGQEVKLFLHGTHGEVAGLIRMIIVLIHVIARSAATWQSVISFCQSWTVVGEDGFVYIIIPGRE